MPGPGAEGAVAIIPATALTEVPLLPEEVAIAGVVGGVNLEQRSRKGPGVFHEHIHHQGELVDLGAATVRGDPVGHHVANAAIEITRNLHHVRIRSVDEGHAQTTAGAEFGLVGGAACRAVKRGIKISQRLSEGCAEISTIEVPLTRHGALRQAGRNSCGLSPTEGHHFRVGEFAFANLNAVHPHCAALVLITIAEQNGGGQKGTACGIQPLICGPVILLDAIDKLGHHRRVGCHVIGCRDAVPCACTEGAVAIIPTTTLTEIPLLPEEVAIAGVVRSIDLQQRGRKSSRVLNQHIHDEGVLVHLGAAAVRGNSVVHDVAIPAVEATRNTHHHGILSVDQGSAEA